MITSILLDGDEFKHFKILDDNNQPTKELQNLSRINVFIGPNNSGKSRFLREVFKVKILKIKFTKSEIDNLEKSYRSFASYWIKNPNESKQTLYNLRKYFFYSNTTDLERWITDTLQSLPKDNISSPEKDFVRQELIKVHKQVNDNYTKKTPKSTYIPILRGLRPLENNGDFKFTHSDLYTERSCNDYFTNVLNPLIPKVYDGKREISMPQGKSIYTGLNIYNDVKSKLLGDRKDREQIRKFENFLSSYFFNNKSITLIPKEGKDVLQLGIEGEIEERLIYEVGDGIQALITLLYPLFINADQENTLVFIEEPELNLHPGMQRIFLEVLKSDAFKNFQFFFTTHSNHFLDMSFEQDSDISVYRFKKNSETEYEVKNLSNPDDNLLQDLGVRNSSVFLSNCTIWVEGITDRLYLKKFLEVYENHEEAQSPYFKRYREDLHYAFVEYAGSNITHWDFSEDSDPEKIKALSLNQNIFLIVDSDCDENGEKKKAERHNKLEKELGDNLYITEGKEFENMLSVTTLNKILTAYKETGSLNVQQDEYKFENLGKFIDANLADKKRTYQKDNSISDKLGFCEKAVKSITSYEDLSEEAQKLCEKLYAFIAKNNS